MPHNTPALSYILATRNKLPYLRETLEKIISNRKGDEEILVADGQSTDGSQEYLTSLKREGKIDYYVSEKDHGVAHALNKLILNAHGELVKYMTDDDAFNFESIQKCKDFMLKHPEIDLTSAESGSLNDPLRVERETDPLQIVRALDYTENYKEWQEDHTPFSFCDLSTMFRRSSLPVLGIYNLSFPGPDVEYSLRTTKSPARIAWYTGYASVNISNPQSVSIVHMKKTKRLTDKLYTFYFNKRSDLSIVAKLKALKNKIKSFSVPQEKSLPKNFTTEWPKLVFISEEWMRIKNTTGKPGFLWNE
jgi:glycosyltransferase involved in cell wall biosynthesis